MKRPTYRGVRCYETTDLAFGHNAEKAEKILQCLDFEQDYTINNIIEFYNIIKIYESSLSIKPEYIDEFEQFKAKSQKLLPVIGRYCSIINASNFLSEYLNVSFPYIDDFWDLISKYKVYKRISSNDFAQFLKNSDVRIIEILHQESIVHQFDNELSEALILYPKSAEILIDKFLVETTNKKMVYIPTSLTLENKVIILNNYILYDDANPNYLELLHRSKNSSQFPLTDKIKVNAGHKYDEFFKERFTDGGGQHFGLDILFDNIEEGVIVDNSTPLFPKFTYSSKWIEENLDYPTLLNNFIYLFGLTDNQSRATFISKTSNIGVIESMIGIKGKRDYKTGVAFRQIQMQTSTSILAYYFILLKNNIEIEDLFKWFFEKYLPSEFGAEGFTYQPPSPDTKFLEKCRNISTEFESVIKQFNIYVEEGFVDRELFEVSSGQVLYEEVKSLNSNKYAYIEDDDLIADMNMLFSDQTTLSYTKKTNYEYNTLFDLLLNNHQITVNDFEEFDIPLIDRLLKSKTLLLSDDGYLSFNNDKVSFLADVYFNEVVCTKYYENNQAVLDYIKDGRIKTSGFLFSKPEYDYLNYMLNKRQFDNGPDLRNTYLHGSNPLSEKIHRTNYGHLLKLMAFAVIKINDEFCKYKK